MQLELEGQRWQVINDGVMGGISRSEVLPAGQGLEFRGHLSLENNGGFASIRRRFSENFSGVGSFRLKVRGDGRTYQFRLRADDSSDGIAWRCGFTTDGSMRVIDLPLKNFEPVIRGRVVSNAGVLNPADIHWLGFMLADGRPGAFGLQVHAIEAVDVVETS